MTRAEYDQGKITSRKLAEVLGIGHEKLKRWSREFLPPDPVAGRQKGVTRVFNEIQVFRLCICGHLVSRLHFSIPESRSIINHLIPWLNQKQLLPGNANNPQIEIKIYNTDQPCRFYYKYKEIIRKFRDDSDPYGVLTEKYKRGAITYFQIPIGIDESFFRVLSITQILDMVRTGYER